MMAAVKVKESQPWREDAGKELIKGWRAGAGEKETQRVSQQKSAAQRNCAASPGACGGAGSYET